MVGKGRPTVDDKRDNQYRVRLNDEENQMLAYCSQMTGQPKSQIFRKACRRFRACKARRTAAGKGNHSHCHKDKTGRRYYADICAAFYFVYKHCGYKRNECFDNRFANHKQQCKQ